MTAKPVHQVDMSYRLFVNDERTVLVRLWAAEPDSVEVAVRETPAHTWGPPMILREEKLSVIAPEWEKVPFGPARRCLFGGWRCQEDAVWFRRRAHGYRVYAVCDMHRRVKDREEAVR